ncbi:MAG TPA: hypothetical protein VND95_13090 [Stellaceae bacterium]|nr:hypothetical protein [Stellaceae bacterium]
MRRLFALRILVLTLAAAGAAVALADPLPVERRSEQPGGAAIVVKSIDLRRDSIVLAVTIANPSDREIRLNRQRRFVLDDDAHGVHYLNPPADNPELRIPPGAQLAGHLVFVGPLAPSARRLTLTSSAEENLPPLTVALPLGGQPGTSDVSQADRADGTALQIRPVVATGANCLVTLQATNGSDETIVLNQDHGLVLTDEHGTAAPVRAPADNRELVVPAGDRLDAVLVFDCRSLDTSRGLTLVTGHRSAGAPDNPDGAPPGFSLKAAVERHAAGVAPAGSHATVRPIDWSFVSAAATPVAAIPAVPQAAVPAPPEAASAVRATVPAPPKAGARLGAKQLAALLHAVKTQRGLRLAVPVDALFGNAQKTLAAAADPLLGQLAELIAATGMHEVVVTVHAGPGSQQADSRERAHAVVAWLERHAPDPRPRFVAATYRGAAAARDKRKPWVDVILRRNYLVPKSRSPASPSPGKM